MIIIIYYQLLSYQRQSVHMGVLKLMPLRYFRGIPRQPPAMTKSQLQPLPDALVNKSPSAWVQMGAKKDHITPFRWPEWCGPSWHPSEPNTSLVHLVHENPCDQSWFYTSWTTILKRTKEEAGADMEWKWMKRDGTSASKAQRDGKFKTLVLKQYNRIRISGQTVASYSVSLSSIMVHL